EFAISLTIIMFLLAGAVEFGIALFQYIQLRDAAQEGALYGSINPTDVDGIRDRVRNASSSPIDLSSLPDEDIEVTVSGGGCVADGVTVRVEYPHRIFMPFATLFTGGDEYINIGAEVTDTILQSTCS
ncbi:MAG: pilus assembly protein, partial [Anaerolineales bacterium]|nr:pilus assembly protein [Anaerolineales bacterium]